MKPNIVFKKSLFPIKREIVFGYYRPKEKRYVYIGRTSSGYYGAFAYANIYMSHPGSEEETELHVWFINPIAPGADVVKLGIGMLNYLRETHGLQKVKSHGRSHRQKKEEVEFDNLNDNMKDALRRLYEKGNDGH